MGIGSILSDVGTGIGRGLKATGAVLSDTLPQVGLMLTGQQGELDQEARKRNYQLEDSRREVLSDALKGALQTETDPVKRTQIAQQIEGLYSAPQAANPPLLQRLHSIIHPGGSVAQHPVVPQGPDALAQALGNATPQRKNPEDYTYDYWLKQGKTPAEAFELTRTQRPVFKQYKQPDGALVWADANNPPDGAVPVAVGAGQQPRGWKRNPNGQITSVLLDRNTNQPIPGTENPDILPPPGMLPRITTGVYHWMDDNYQIHETPEVHTSTPSYGGYSASPTPAATPGAPPSGGAVAPPARPIVPKKVAHVPATTSADGAPPVKLTASHGDRILGTKGVGQGELTPQSQQVLARAQPVVLQANRLIADIDRLGLANNNTRMYLAPARLDYATGHASPVNTLAHDIAGLSLGSLVEATSALNAQGGGSRSMPALEIALKHTPNPWVDSPMMIRSKLVEINNRLGDVIKEVQTEGVKHFKPKPQASGQSGAASSGTTVKWTRDANGNPVPASQ